MIIMDRMNVQLFVNILLFVIIGTFAKETNNYSCGPNKVCNCYNEPHIIGNLTMDCSGKSLTNLSEICGYLDNTTRLDASSNSITGTLDESDVRGCENLLTLSLRNNTVTDITQNVFKKLHNLRDLDLSNTTLPVYAGNWNLTFSDLVNLEILKINGNLQNTGIFAASTRYPDLTRNKHLRSLFTDGLRNDGHPFPALASLNKLVVSGFKGICDIQSIDDSFLAALLHLETLDLSFCKLAEISLNAFTQLKNLKWLDLSNNRRLGLRPLFNVSYGLQFTQIEVLNMSYVYNTFGLGKQIRKQDVCFLKNTTLREILLDGNRLELFETNSLMLFPSSLKKMSVSDNRYTFGNYMLQMACAPGTNEFYGAFQNAFHDPRQYSKEPNEPINQTAIYYADCPFMKDEYLKRISENIPSCNFLDDRSHTIQLYPPSIPANLTKIIFHDCNMKFSPLSLIVFPLLNKIEHIDASGNIFQTWDGPIGPLFNLKYLDMSRTYCSKIRKHFFEYIPNIENLQIHSNFIGLSLTSKNVSRAFHNLTQLTVMNLTMNKITYLHPQTLHGLTSLKTLDLSDNSIDTWTLDVHSLSNLTHVNLTNNALQALPIRMMQHLFVVSKRHKTKFTINLRQNTLKYGCQTKDFLFWMMEHREAFVGFNTYVFIDDDGDQVKTDDIETKVEELKKKCQSNVVWIVSSSIGVSIALSVIIFGIIYRNRWKLRYLMYMTKHRFYGYVKIPDNDPVENYKYDAFISYAEESIRFVKDQLIPRIENNGVSLCVHQRDFLPGNAIADNIVDAIQSSRKTVVLLTNAFLKKKWCMYEFNMPRMENIYSRDDRGCVVMVLLEDVPARLMPAELINWMKTESYLEYTTDPDGEELFWNNLAEALH